MPDDATTDRETFAAERQAAVDAAADALTKAELEYQSARARWKSHRKVTELADAVIQARKNYAAAWQAREKAGVGL